jgi:hypothetical protein
MPNGFTLGKCSQEFNTKLIPTPNTLTKCLIEGIPIKAGLYHLKMSVTNKDNDAYRTVENTVDLIVSEAQTSKR